jgi:hypothetical protein
MATQTNQTPKTNHRMKQSIKLDLMAFQGLLLQTDA